MIRALKKILWNITIHMAIRINANQTCLFVMIFAVKYPRFYFKHLVNRFLSMNVLEEAFNKETALVGAFSEHCEIS